MSHVAPIELEIRDLEALKDACKELGFEFVQGQEQYKWFGVWVEDYPLPEGFTTDDLGKCTHAIRVPGANYEVGVIERAGKFTLMWDFWDSGGLLGPMGGRSGVNMIRAYTRAKVKRQIRHKRGANLTEKRLEDRVRLTVTL
jgi:hypothetical protein